MKLKHKEGYWFVSLLLLAIIINVTFFGTTVFDKKDTININIHDTYFVIPQIYLVIVSTVSIWFWIYLIRMLYNKFTNLIVNSIFMTSCILMTFVILYLLLFLNVLNQPNNDIPVNPDPVSGILNIAYNIALVIQFFLLLLLTYTGIKTGIHSKKRK